MDKLGIFVLGTMLGSLYGSLTMRFLIRRNQKLNPLTSSQKRKVPSTWPRP